MHGHEVHTIGKLPMVGIFHHDSLTVIELDKDNWLIHVFGYDCSTNDLIVMRIQSLHILPYLEAIVLLTKQINVEAQMPKELSIRGFLWQHDESSTLIPDKVASHIPLRLLMSSGIIYDIPIIHQILDLFTKVLVHRYHNERSQSLKELAYFMFTEHCRIRHVAIVVPFTCRRI